MHLILKEDRFVLISFGSWVKIQSFAQFPMDHFSPSCHAMSCTTWLLLGRLAFVPDGVSKSMADSRLTSAGPPLGERAAFRTSMHSLYSTGPHGLVQAIFWYTCLDLDLSPWYCLTHWTHIALGGSMTSRVWVSAHSQPSLP